MTPQSPVLQGLAIELPEFTAAANQPPYAPLPMLLGADENGIATSRWRLTWRERIRVLICGDVWLQIMTFHRGIPPAKVMARQPQVEECL